MLLHVMHSNKASTKLKEEWDWGFCEMPSDSRQQRLTTVVLHSETVTLNNASTQNGQQNLNEITGLVPGISFAGNTVRRHVLVQKVGDVGVLKLTQEPRLAHDEFERFSVDVHTLQHASALSTQR
jgi:hypothetical protein